MDGIIVVVISLPSRCPRKNWTCIYYYFFFTRPRKKVKHRMLFISVLATSPCIYSLWSGLVSNTFLSLLMSLPLYGIFVLFLELP